MTQNDQGTFSLLGNVHLDAICFNHPVIHLNHFFLSIRVKDKE